MTIAVAHYNKISGLCALIAPCFIPIAGLITDWQIKKASQRKLSFSCPTLISKAAILEFSFLLYRRRSNSKNGFDNASSSFYNGCCYFVYIGNDDLQTLLY